MKKFALFVFNGDPMCFNSAYSQELGGCFHPTVGPRE